VEALGKGLGTREGLSRWILQVLSMSQTKKGGSAGHLTWCLEGISGKISCASGRMSRTLDLPFECNLGQRGGGGSLGLERREFLYTPGMEGSWTVRRPLPKGN